MAKTNVIYWPVVLSAFCAGLTLTFYLAGRESRQNRSSAAIGRLLSGLALTTALVTLGLIVSAASHSTGAASVVRPLSFVTHSDPTQRSSILRLAKRSTVHRPSSPPPLPTDALPRLQIPSLNVDEPVQTIPIRDGQWDLTALGLGIGQLTTTGTHPGDDWAMVFVGHVNLSGMGQGSFAYLRRLKQNAEVIYQAAGTNYVYRVETLSRARPEDVNRLYLADGNRLLLVTCIDWDATQRIYTNRLIVQARLEETLSGLTGKD